MKFNLKKTWEMVIRGKSIKKPVPEEISNIERREGVFFNKNPLIGINILT